MLDIFLLLEYYYLTLFYSHKMKKNRSDVIRTIQEIAKIDEYTINQAIEACQDSEGRYSMDQVLNILMDEVNHFFYVTRKLFILNFFCINRILLSNRIKMGIKRAGQTRQLLEPRQI